MSLSVAIAPRIDALRTNGVAWMLGASLLFAVMATLIGIAHRHDPSLSTFVTSDIRAIVNLLFLVGFVRGDIRRLIGDARPSLWARGLLGTLSLFTYFGALASISPGEAAFLNQTSSVWVAVFAPFWLGEPTPRLIWVALAGSLLGIALMMDPQAAGHAYGRILALASGLTAAGAYLSIRTASRTNRPETIVFWFTAVGTILGSFTVWFTQASWPHDPLVWTCLIGSGLAAACAQLAMTRAYQITRAGIAAATAAAGPLFTTMLSFLILGDQPTFSASIGMAILCITGIGLPWLAEFRERRANLAPAAHIPDSLTPP